MTIHPFDSDTHREPVIALWRTVFGYTAAHNDPGLAIDKKIAVDDLFFVAEEAGRVVGTVMAGYDGHRGWIYSMAVHPDIRKQGFGSALLGHALQQLKSRGCTKVNLQILAANTEVLDFYRAHGFEMEDRISMGMRL